MEREVRSELHFNFILNVVFLSFAPIRVILNVGKSRMCRPIQFGFKYAVCVCVCVCVCEDGSDQIYISHA